MINRRMELQSMFPNSSLSELYKALAAMEFTQKVEINEEFTDYALDGDVYHEAGFDALMTGIVFYRLMGLISEDKQYPGIESILADDQITLRDKNGIPLASIKKSLDLSEPSDPEILPTL